LDFTKVNVSLMNPSGVTTFIGKVDNLDACAGAGQSAWYYDNNVAPTTISLCPTTCSQVTDAVVGSRVNVVVGCEGTIIVE
jgi:hypothetical protein